MPKSSQNQRLTQKQKEKNNKAWYKEQIDMLDKYHVDDSYSYGEVSDIRRMKVNYDLFNNIIDLSDFEHVCKPLGAEAGELPAKMANRDIVSGKIKALLGMEMKRSFSWKVLAVNPEATTRKEQEQSKRIREFVINEITKPFRVEAEKKYLEQQKGRELNEEEQAKIQQQIEEEVQSMTPDEVLKYMEREHQDPAEILSQQLLQYLIQKTDAKTKFNKAFKHGLLSAREVAYIGIINDEPVFWNVNSLRFRHDRSPDLDYIEDGEWATYEHRLQPSQIISYFGDNLTQKEIDLIYENWSIYRGNDNSYDDLFQVLDNDLDEIEDNSGAIPVLHCTWKSLRKIGFLNYLDDEGVEQEIIVDENYEIDEENGDLNIEWEWIPECYEGWKIKTGEPIYINMRPVPGQFKDIDNIYECKLPYFGVVYDHMNSQPTSLMDRLVPYQYFYNIICYRLETLLASDKGKKVLMNIGAIPSSEGIDLEKWMYYANNTSYIPYNPNEEDGAGYMDANTVAKVLDLSLVSDIQKYIQIAEYIRSQAGKSVGVTEQVEGQISSGEAVRNTQQSLIQTQNILEPYFELHNIFKKNVLQGLLSCAKVAYSNSENKKLTYILDDISQKVLDLDVGLLEESTLGLFVSNSAKAEEAKENIKQLAHAALQNQKAELSDIISIIRQESVTEAEETLKASEQKQRDYEQKMNSQNIQAQKEEAEKQRQREREKFEEEKELIILKEEEKRKTELMKSSIMGASYNPDVDRDNNGVNDFLEIEKFRNENLSEMKRINLEEKKIEQDRQLQERKLDIEEKKIKGKE